VCVPCARPLYSTILLSYEYEMGRYARRLGQILLLENFEVDFYNKQQQQQQ